MHVGKLSIETFSSGEALAIINCENGDRYEITGVSYNHARNRAEDCCVDRKIILKQFPHQEGRPVKSIFRYQFISSRF